MLQSWFVRTFSRFHPHTPSIQVNAWRPLALALLLALHHIQESLLDHLGGRRPRRARRRPAGVRGEVGQRFHGIRSGADRGDVLRRVSAAHDDEGYVRAGGAFGVGAQAGGRGDLVAPEKGRDLGHGGVDAVADVDDWWRFSWLVARAGEDGWAWQVHLEVGGGGNARAAKAK